VSKMSNQLILIPSTVKPHDVERNSLKQAAPVPFIKPLDNQPVTKEHKVKISTSSDSTTAEYLYPFQGGTGEDYLLHRILLEDLINKMNLQDTYNGYEKEMKNVVDDLEEHDRSKPSEAEWTDVVATSTNASPSTEDTSPSSVAGGGQKSDDKDKETAKQLFPHQTKGEKWEARRLTLTDRRRIIQSDMHKILVEVFDLVELLLCEEMKVAWLQLKNQVCYSPYKDDSGVEHTEHRGLTWESLDLCERQWMLSVFDKDAAEKQRMYMQYYLLYSSKVSIRQFIQRIEQLNGYLPKMPCMADDKTLSRRVPRMSKAFNEVELCNMILHMFPRTYEDHYTLTHPNDPVPIDLSRLRESLESIQKVVEAAKKNKSHDSSTPAADTNNKSKGQRKRGKSTDGKGGSSSKRRRGRHCALCEEHGGYSSTHNTEDCKKWTADGKPNPSWKKKGTKTDGDNRSRDKSRSSDHGTKRSFAQLQESVQHLTNIVAKHHIGQKRKRHHSAKRYRSDSSESSYSSS